MIRGNTGFHAAILGMTFTFLSIYFLQKEYDFKLNLADKFFIFIFPTLYLASSYYVLYDKGYFFRKHYNFSDLYQLGFYVHVINPLVIASVMLLLGLTKLKDLTNLRNIFIFTYITLFYSYFSYPEWINIWIGAEVDNFKTELPQESAQQNAEKPELNYQVNLSNFSFINADRDTVSLVDTSNQYILLETWSEHCFPCIKAMNELPSFYQSISNRVRVYYLYESGRESVRNNFDKIFEFKSISNKSKILIDVHQDLYKSLGMQGYPYFLIFDSKGNLLHHIRGYLGKEMVIDELRRHL